LGDAGNIKDAAILAAVTAMNKASIPEATADGSTVTIDMDKRTPLVSRLVIPVTVGMLDDYCFVDPVTKEENSMDGCVTSVLDAETFAFQFSTMVSFDLFGEIDCVF
jgi:exosome complex RNA-binding protein Rrp42 (RNase PH superfamily)